EWLLRAGKAAEARTRFQKARGLLAGGKEASGERNLLLVDLGLTQVDLGGNKEEGKAGTRLKWDDGLKEMQVTLENVLGPEARGGGLRQMSGALIARGQVGGAVSLASTLFGGEEETGMALVGLELWRAKQEKQAEAALEQGLQRFAAGGAAKLPPASAPLAAL